MMDKKATDLCNKLIVLAFVEVGEYDAAFYALVNWNFLNANDTIKGYNFGYKNTSHYEMSLGNAATIPKKREYPTVVYDWIEYCE